MDSQLGSFVSDFFGGESAQHVQQQPAGTIAVATGDSRQIIGNIINNYHPDIAGHTQLAQAWLRIQQWLSPSQQALDTQAMLDRDSRTRHFEGTCAWYTGSQEFQEWLSGSRRLEWVHGGVGRGKTVLFSEAVGQTVQHCHGQKAMKVCYFYCTTRDPSGKDATVLVRFLLAQLLQTLSASGPITRLYEECHAVYPPKVPTTRDLMATLLEIVQNRDNETGHIYIMIDGLDEIPFETTDREEVLEFLSDLAGSNLDHISLFVTSRGQPDIQDAFNEAVVWSQTPVDSSKIQGDIDRYVSQKLQSDRRLRRLSPQVRESIRVEISTKADGMFLWTALQISYLANRRPLTDESALNAVRSLPSSLNDTYYRILQGIQDGFTALASRALTWLAFSSRTLFIEELIDACAVDLDRIPEPVLGTRLEPYQLFEMLNDLILIQPALISLEEPPRHGIHTVTFCHASVREFLQSIGSPNARTSGYSPRMDVFLIEHESANLMIARACLAYLFYYNTTGAKSSEFPLLGYSWYRWERHVGVGTRSEYPSDDNSIVRKKASDIYTELSARLIGSSLVVSRGSVFPYLNWLRPDANHRLLDALNMPYFYPNFDSFFGFDRHRDLSQRTSSARYCYQPLCHSRSSTRVLELLPCLDKSTTIRCRLIEKDLDERPDYLAISYAWGLIYTPVEAMVHGVRMSLLPSQARILRLLRSRKEGAISNIWIDVLCINQEDVFEKSHQVLMMGRIYSQAQQVIVSLGEKPPDAAQGLAVLGKIAATMDIVSQVSRQDGEWPRRQALDTLDTLEKDGNAKALECLFQDSWWTRAWIIQEIVLASDVGVLMGDFSFNFNAIELAVAADSILQRHLRHPERTRWRRLTAFPGWEAAKSILNIRSEWRSHRQLPVHPLFWKLRHNNCRNPRDHLYAILGICSPSDARRVPPDYTMSVAKLSLVFTTIAIENYTNLDALSITSVLNLNTCSSEADSRTPSWAIDITAPHAHDREPLVLGVFGWPQEPSLYAATGTITDHDQERPTVQGEVLRTHGFILGCVRRVDRLDEALENKGVYDDPGAHDYALYTLNAALRELCARISGWMQRDGLHQVFQHKDDSPTRVRWRTLLADQWPMGQRLDGGFFMDSPVPCTEQEEASLLLNLEIQVEDMPLLRGRAVILTDNYALGLVPEQTQVGDRIAFLFGGSVPYILRQHEDYYRLVGECYLHGYMDGEIFRESHKTRMISIV